MHWKNGLFATTATAIILSLAPAPAAMAQSTSEARIQKLEKEMRAVQRKVFPGGDSRYFEPEITPATPGGSATTTQPGGGMTPDMLVRIDSLESALQRLTGRIEEQELAISDMQAQLAAMNGTRSATTPAAPIQPPAAATPATKPATNAAPDPGRVAAVAAIEKPSTGDAGEDAYSYGFRLWDAKFYPEARIALEDYIKKYPKHSRISYARNLLGRAWLDDGKPASSVDIFLNNYQSDPKGLRAPDSLLFLSQALTQLNQTDKACVVLDELKDVYPDVASARLSSDVATMRSQAKCR